MAGIGSCLTGGMVGGSPYHLLSSFSVLMHEPLSTAPSKRSDHKISFHRSADLISNGIVEKNFEKRGILAS